MSAIRVLRIAGWLGVCLVVFLSVIPADIQIRTGASKWLEHAAAYFLLGSVLACAYGTGRRSIKWIALLLIGLSGSLEIVQKWCPGRTPSLDDWFGGIVGGITAIAMYLALRGLWEGHLGDSTRHASPAPAIQLGRQADAVKRESQLQEQ